MANEIAGLDVPVEASGDLSGNQFYLVNIDGSGQLALAGAGEPAYALQTKPDAAGKAGNIRLTGLTKVVSGAAVTAGALLMANASGKAITATATNDVVGQALTSSAADGEVITMIINGGPLA